MQQSKGEVLWQDWQVEDALGTSITAPLRYDITGISIDTRSLQRGDMFIALRGDRVDGHNYLEKAVQAGASLLLVEYLPESIDATHVPCILVEDAYEALEKLALYRRNYSQAKVIGLTGSVGKTSTKDAIKAVLSDQGSCYATEGNLNNHIGVPLSLARMPVDVDYAVFEMGMNHAHEISPLSVMVRPDVAIITAIAPVHIEFFEGTCGIVDAKCEIMDGLKKDGVMIIPNGRYEHQMRVRASERKLAHIVTFGEGRAECELQQFTLNDKGSEAKISLNGCEYIISLQTLGKHQASNAAVVLAAVEAIGADVTQAVASLATIEPSKGRGKHYHFTQPTSWTLIDDSYNAGPDSMKASLEIFAQLKPKGQKIAILGQMLELGEGSDHYHADLKSSVEAAKIDQLYLVGEYMVYLDDVLSSDISVSYVESYDQLDLSSLFLKQGDVVLVKGSHGSLVYKAVDYWLDHYKT